MPDLVARVPSIHVTVVHTALSLTAAYYFWRRASRDDPAWRRRTDIFGDGTNGYDVVRPRFRPDLIPRIRELLCGPYERFSVVLFFYDSPLGSGEPWYGALWLDGEATVVTESVAEVLPVTDRLRDGPTHGR